MQEGSVATKARGDRASSNLSTLPNPRDVHRDGAQRGRGRMGYTTRILRPARCGVSLHAGRRGVRLQQQVPGVLHKGKGRPTTEVDCTVWCNPPYDRRHIRKWLAKGLEAAIAGATVEAIRDIGHSVFVPQIRALLREGMKLVGSRQSITDDRVRTPLSSFNDSIRPTPEVDLTSLTRA
jgi:hypothetical protein